jgi:hypothetical protein
MVAAHTSAASWPSYCSPTPKAHQDPSGFLVSFLNCYFDCSTELIYQREMVS